MSDPNINQQLREAILAQLKVAWPDAATYTGVQGVLMRHPSGDGTYMVLSNCLTINTPLATIEAMAHDIVDTATKHFVNPIAVGMHEHSAFVFEMRAYATILFLPREQPT